MQKIYKNKMKNQDTDEKYLFCLSCEHINFILMMAHMA